MKSKTRTILSLVILLSISTQFLTYSIGESVDPIEKSYTLPAQSWYFILEDENLTANTVFSFEWSSDIEIQGTPVSETDYSAMQAMNLLERSNYFESLAYIEGKIDTGKVTANQNGEIFFVFFNADTVQANLSLKLESNAGSLSPAVIGLISALAVIVFLSIIVYVTIKIRQKMLKEAEEEEELTPQQRYMQNQ
ncbi:MAG: hypothetical protein ACTSQK_00950 [Candidatus Heimdallarchaeota archaeon]